eukprot:COSAG01_NODE_52_length_31456_cov_125.226648_4_plen_224_part_00
MTESSPVIACNHPEAFKFGTVGQKLDCSTIKITEDNELCIKGPHVMKGYFKHNTKDDVHIDKEGWLHTGDIVSIDKENYIKIIDRKKDIIVLATGKNIAPQPIEERIKESKFINQIVLIGNKKPYLSALVIPEKESIVAFAIKNKISYDAYINLLKNKKIIDKIKEVIKNKQIKQANYEKIKRIELLADEFTEKRLELTPTLKPKRKVIYKNHEDKINKIYND